MSSGEEHDNEREGEQRGGGDTCALNEDDGDGSSASAGQPQDKLGEGWPQIEVDRDKGLVVCTIDAQLLSDTVQVMHSQIDLLRQTVLDLRQTESGEMADLRRKIGALEDSGPGNAKSRLDDIHKRLRAVEQPLREHGNDAGLNHRLELLEGAIWGASTARKPSDSTTAPSDKAEAEAEEAEEEDRSLEVVGHSSDGDEVGAREEEEWGEGEDAAADAGDAAAGDAAARKPPSLKTVAKTAMMFGGMALCPKVETLQSQLGTIGERESKVEERVAALESKLSAEAEGLKVAAAEERRLKSLGHLLRQAVVLRRVLLADAGIVAVAGGAEAAEEEVCWAGTGAGEEVSTGEGRSRGIGEEEASEEELRLRVFARLAWLDAHASPSGNFTFAAAAADASVGDDSEPKGDDEAAAHDTNIEGGVAAEGTFASEHEGGDQQRAAGTSPSLAWAPLGEEEKESPRGGTSADDVERLWRRMYEVESRIYQARADERRRQSQTSKVSPPAAEVSCADLKDLRESLEQASTALGNKFQDGLGSLSGRVKLLEDNVRMVKARALSRSALDAVSAASAAAAAATAAAGGGERPAAVAPPDDSRIEQILASVLGDEIPMVRRNLDGVRDRVTSLEAALEDAAASPPGPSAEEAAAAAATAVREANAETQARMIAEMSALEERMDRRAREEARRAREEREAAEARGSMRRVSATVSAYTADLASRLEGLRSEHEQQGAVLTRTAEEMAAAEANLRDFGSELVGLGQVANSVSMVVDGKADQTDVEALKAAMGRLDATVAAKARGNSATAARDAEAFGALQAAFKDMSTSMEGSMRKLQQAQAAAGSIKIKPLLDRIVKELTAAGMLPDPDAGQGAAGRSMCLSCNRPMSVAGDQPPSRFANQFRGGTLGNRMEKVSSASPLQINKPAVIWRGGFKMPPRRVPASSHERQQQQQPQQQQQQQQQHHPQQHQRAATAGLLEGDGRRGAPATAGSGGGRGNVASPSQASPASSSVRAGAGLDAFRDSRLPGIPNMLDSSAGGGERGISGAVVGVGSRGGRMSVGSLTASADAPHRARFVRQR